jgi:ATP-dependent helicase/nuclease subunit B
MERRGADDRRVFLGWERPALVSAAEWLWEGGVGDGARGEASARAQGAEVDLSHLCVVTPGGRAGRVLLALLAECASGGRGSDRGGGGAISPPRMLTPGRLVELLAPDAPAQRLASPMAKCAAWSRALRGLDAGAMEALCPSLGGVAGADQGAWDALARMILRAHDELGLAGMRLREVPARARDVMLDEARWGALAEAEERYLALLRKAGLADPVVEAREAAARGEDFAGAAVAGAELVLVGVTELTATARAAAERLGAIALVAAPQSLADRFDALGCVFPDAWAEAELEIDDGRLVFCEDPRDEALCAAGIVARDHADRAPGAITIGAADAAAIAPLKRACRDGLGVSARAATGRPASQAPIGRLLSAMAEFLETESFRSYAALVRSPLMEHALLRRANAGRGPPRRVEWWLGRLDKYQNEHQPGAVGGRGENSWRGQEDTKLADLERQVRRLLRPLAGRARSASEWAEPIGQCLRRIVRAQPRAADGVEARRREAEVRLVGEALTELSQLQALSPELVPASAAVALVVDRLAEAFLPEEAGADCIEILGWLELALDPAPAMVVTGLTEQALGARRSDGLITQPLRRSLGLPDDAAQLARDAAALVTILGTRPDVALLCPRRDSQKNPLTPSRLLLMAGAETIARRLLRFAGEAPEGAPPPRVAQPACGAACGFYPAPILVLPARDPAGGDGAVAPALETMSVTEFRTFLQSPYLYYLQRVMRAEALEDCAREMDAMRFGSLLHSVLEVFGRSDAREETRADRIEAFCREALAEIALERFGASPPVAVWVQLDMAQRRLARFAAWQAERAREGWRILETEWKPGKESLPRLEIPGQAPVGLRGKIDRIDVRDGEIAILDYKTSAKPAPPKDSHGPNRAGEWRDLQLPLYRVLYPGASGDGRARRVRLAYVALPSETDETSLQEAAWSAADLDSAIETAREVVRRIRRTAFDDFGRLGGWRQDCATEAILARRQITATDPFARLSLEGAVAGAREGGA